MPVNPFLTLDELRRERQQRAFQAAQQGAMAVGAGLLDYDGLVTAKRRLEEDRQRRLEEAQMQRTRDARDAQMQQHTIGMQNAAAARIEEDRTRERALERAQGIAAGSKSLDEARGAAAQDPTTGVLNDDDVAKVWLDAEGLREERKRLAEKQQAEIDAARALAEQRRAAAEKALRPPPPKAPPRPPPAPKPAKPSPSEDKKAQALATARSKLDHIDKILALKAKFSTGPIESRLRDASAFFGFPIAGWAEFKTRVTSELNDYIVAITGAGGGTAEMKRIASVMANPNTNDEEFMEQMGVFRERALEEIEKLSGNAGGSTVHGTVAAAPSDGDWLFGEE